MLLKKNACKGWADSEPNDLDFEEDCVNALGTGGPKWATDVCENKYYSICELQENDDSPTPVSFIKTEQ